MALNKTQQAIWERVRALGAGGQAKPLSEQSCAYLVGRVALDIGLGKQFPEFKEDLVGFFGAQEEQVVSLKTDSIHLFERLVQMNKDADMYFACLATLHKARLKYETILETQPIPTLEQVGPRGLLQYGKLGSEALVGFLFWRKWFFDIDNRAGQETGYLFEPVIANAIGGTPVPARKSPIKRHREGEKTSGRQVDCVLGKRAYELKIRVTIAASGQGRWGEEMDFPIDCRESGYTPVLVVLDSTPNAKLKVLEAAFIKQKGEVYIGAQAWAHLEGLAGSTMSRFLERYVRAPLDDLITKAPTTLPDLIARSSNGHITITVGGESLKIPRNTVCASEEQHDQAPEDADEEVPG
jgi:hypothetical protein